MGDLRGIKYIVGEGKYRDRIDAFISIDGDGSNRIVNREMGSRRYRVTITGPNNLSALLNALQMGFRTLAIEKRSSEVWELLSAVKTEFGKFGDVLAKTRDQLETVTMSIGQAEVRTRQMARKLKDVEALPASKTAKLLGEQEVPEEDDAAA